MKWFTASENCVLVKKPAYAVEHTFDVRYAYAAIDSAPASACVCNIARYEPWNSNLPKKVLTVFFKYCSRQQTLQLANAELARLLLCRTMRTGNNLSRALGVRTSAGSVRNR